MAYELTSPTYTLNNGVIVRPPLDQLIAQFNAFGLTTTYTLEPATAPAAPANGWTIYVDSGDADKLKAIASNGTIVTLGTP